MDCMICGDPCLRGRVTCSDDCHEKFVEKVEAEFGRYKKVIDALTGFAYRVPTRDLIEKGLKWRDLALKYPLWETRGE